jgi:hypothetical protein
MATPLQQQALNRKFIYFGVIIVLFTISVIHSRWVLKPQAYRLQLAEESRGDVELTSSAVRLTLTGSRGLAVTMLWYTAMDKQKRGEYHELELLVKSITKLQPYFITPWLYQSWNISFNVAVECDKPRDKYYYISRGLEMLAEGERRNRGAGKEEGGPTDPDRVVFPGHPELRHYMGFFYQLKIGTSDERLTMRSLIELSCIDPIERDSDVNEFWKKEPGKRVVNLEKFQAFCAKNPRLVRRLREQLKYTTPERIVKFLDDHKEIPSRFKPIDKARQVTQSELKPIMEQFPILPLPEADDWPDPRNRQLSEREAVDVYLLCRTWYEFAQLPLPPAQANATPQTQEYDKVKYRVPRHMVTQLFRGYPARAQVYIAETLEAEGFFDNDGWEIKDWFTKPVNVGQAAKYHSRLAWDKGYKYYEKYGIENGIYLPAQKVRELEEQAKLCQKPTSEGGLGLRPGEGPPQATPAAWREDKEKAKSLEAHSTLYYSDFFRRLANFNAFFYQAEAERDEVTTAARKALFQAELKRKTDAPSELLLAYYDKAWTLYIHACLKYPRFAQVSSMQEDLYEIHQRYLELGQKVHRDAFSKRAVLAAKVGFYPYPLNAQLEPTTEQVDAAVAQLAFWPTSNVPSVQAASRTTRPGGVLRRSDGQGAQGGFSLPVDARGGPGDEHERRVGRHLSGPGVLPHEPGGRLPGDQAVGPDHGDDLHRQPRVGDRAGARLKNWRRHLHHGRAQPQGDQRRLEDHRHRRRHLQRGRCAEGPRRLFARRNLDDALATLDHDRHAPHHRQPLGAGSLITLTSPQCKQGFQLILACTAG